MTKTLLLALIMAIPSRGPQAGPGAAYEATLAPALEMNALGALAVRCKIRSKEWYLAVQTAAIREAERAAEGAWGGTDMRLSPKASRHFDEALAAMATAERVERSAPLTTCGPLSTSMLLSALDRSAKTMDVDPRHRSPIAGLVFRTTRRAASRVWRTE